MTENSMLLFGLETFDTRAELERLHRNWGWVVAFGAVLLALGIIACGAAGFATLASVIFVGWLLAIAGAVQIFHAFSFRIGHGLVLNLLGGILYAVVGVLMLARPAAGAVSLTLLLSAFFLVSGIFRSVLSVAARYPSWGWGLFSGVLTTILGVMIGASWPSSAFWVIGMFVGIEMIFSGWSGVMLGFAAREYRSESIPAASPEEDLTMEIGEKERVSSTGIVAGSVDQRDTVAYCGGGF